MKSLLSYACHSVVLHTLEYSRTDEIKCTVSQLQSARCSPQAWASNTWLTMPGRLKLANDAFYLIRFCCVPVYGVPLNHERKTFHFSFFKVLDGLTQLMSICLSLPGTHYIPQPIWTRWQQECCIIWLLLIYYMSKVGFHMYESHLV
jgi:hypothetical protein